MHIVESGKRYRIFNNAITTYDQLPPKTYRVDYDPETRIFSLLEAHDFEIPETKIYGQHLDKVKKVLNSMDKMNRNLGVILSGDKGIVMSFILFLVFLDLIYTLFIGIPIGIISFLFIG